MTLKERINEDMKTAMRAKETARLGAIRLLLAAIKQKEVDERIELDDAAVLAVIDKMLKQRRDSIAQYEGRPAGSGRRGKIRDRRAHRPTCPRPSPPRRSRPPWPRPSPPPAPPGPGHGQGHGGLKPKLAGRADMTARSPAWSRPP
jgi:hypothetical protein